MASNSFGKIFRITTWGESHGKAIGVVIDGCPAGIAISEEEIHRELLKRAPGKSPFTSPRKEEDVPEILSGLFEGITTGAPISILIRNRDHDPSQYETNKHLLQPGHANYTYLQKYGIFDHRGGGRASARETACRVAAGAIAKKFLQQYEITPLAYICEIAGIQAKVDFAKLTSDLIQQNPLFCPDINATQQMMEKIEEARHAHDSVGGVVELLIPQLPTGLGDPVYDKLDVALTAALMSIPASKGVEIGEGFAATRMRGSQHNDGYTTVDQKVRTTTNHAGGILGGISTGMPLIARVGFKPTSGIKQAQQTVDVNGQPATLEISSHSRHDPCVAIRAVPVVEAMAALVLADAILCNRSAVSDPTV